MKRRITGYGVDEAGERFAWLECGHRQHVRHRPPFINRPWTQTQAGRDGMVGEELSCPRCEAAEDDWFFLSLGDALTADDRLAAIAAQFRRVFEEAGQPRGLALFKRHDTEHSLQCSITLYFSPAAQDIAAAAGAARCGRPNLTNLETITAAPGWRELLFSRNL